MAEAKRPKRVADIINLIGAITTGVSVPKVAPQIPFTEPEIEEREPVRASNIYELAEKAGIEPPSITFAIKKSLSSPKKRMGFKPETWEEYFSIIKEPRSKVLELQPRLTKFQIEVEKGGKTPELALEKLFKLSQKYPIDKTQAKAIYELISSPLSQEAVKKWWGKVLTPEGLKEEVQKTLTGRAKKSVEVAKEKYKPIKKEKLKLPEPVWQKGYKGETLAEKARKSVDEYNKNVKNIADYTKNIANSLKSEDTAKYISFYINSDLAWEVAKELYRKSGGMLDLSNLHKQLTETSAKSKKYLTEVSSTLKKLFDIKADLLKEVKDLVS